MQVFIFTFNLKNCACKRFFTFYFRTLAGLSYATIVIVTHECEIGCHLSVFQI